MTLNSFSLSDVSILFKHQKAIRDGNSKNPILLTTTKELLQSKTVTSKYLNSSSNLFQV
jgi:hypothetical protein